MISRDQLLDDLTELREEIDRLSLELLKLYVHYAPDSPRIPELREYLELDEHLAGCGVRSGAL